MVYPHKRPPCSPEIRSERATVVDNDVGRPESLLLFAWEPPHCEISAHVGGAQCSRGSSLNASDGQCDLNSEDSTYAEMPNEC